MNIKFKGFIRKERTQIDDLNFHLKKKVKKKKGERERIKHKQANQTRKRQKQLIK